MSKTGSRVRRPSLGIEHWALRHYLVIGQLVLGHSLLAFFPGCTPRPSAPPPAPEPETTNHRPKTDLYGDPLPPGAIARMGTVRMRPKRAIRSIVFSSDGKTLASGSDDGMIYLWGIATKRKLIKIGGHEGSVYSVAFSPNDKTLASGSADKTIRLWEVATGKELLKFEGHEGAVFSVVLSPDGKTLASGSEDRTIRLWEIATGKELLKIERHAGRAFSVAFSPDGKTLSSGSEDNTIRLWEVATGKELLKLGKHEGSVYSVPFSPDGKTLASGSEDKTIRLWEVATGKELLKIEGHAGRVYSVAFSPDGKTLASGSEDHTIRLWEVASGMEFLNLAGHECPVHSVAFSPDGKTLASGSEEKTIRLWEVATGKELLKFGGHEGPVYSVAFSPDGKTLASGSWDTTALVWDVSAILGTSRTSDGPVKQRTLADLWRNLAGVDASAAYAAMEEMRRAGAEGVAFVNDRLKRESSDENKAKRIIQLIRELDDNDISVREAATKDLKEVGVTTEPLLRAALDNNPSAEATLRIERILAYLERPLPIPAGEPLRRHRAIQVLERIGSPEAREALDRLAKESPSLRERQEARAACQRLDRRGKTR